MGGARTLRTTSSSPAPSGGKLFGPELFRFLGELALTNERQWFDANKDRYERDVREPALEFVRRIAPALAGVSKQFVASDKKVGGSLMRIHRDVRFSRDKAPYKTNVGLHFRHGAGKDVHAPGIYLHIEPASVFLGVGMWHPEPEALARLRAAIVDDPDEYVRVCANKSFTRSFSLRGDSLSRPPRGFDPEHPLIDELKRKDHIAVCDFEAAVVTKPGFVETLAERMRASAPYLRWQVEALGLPF
jgi:uncharacterized protein (TIGR02453 family)